MRRMTYNDGYALKRKSNGMFYVPKRKREDGSEYTPAEYRNVDKKCKCKCTIGRYCTNFLGSKRHVVHICVRCTAIMPKCLVP